MSVCVCEGQTNNQTKLKEIKSFAFVRFASRISAVRRFQQHRPSKDQRTETGKSWWLELAGLNKAS